MQSRRVLSALGLQTPSGRMFQPRVDRLIGTARAVLAAFMLAAVWLDPTEPARYASVSYAILVGYAGLSLAVAGLAWKQTPVSALAATLALGADPVFYTTVVLVTEGPASPFLIISVFPTVAALFKWGWRGALYMAVAAVGLRCGTTLFFVYHLGAPLELNRFLVRTANFLVAAAMLVFFARHQDDIAQDMIRLAAGPGVGSPDDDTAAPLAPS